MSDATLRCRIWWLPAASLLLLIVASLVADCSQATLRDVCRNAQVPFGSVQDFERLVEELERDQSFEVCPERYRPAFSQLASIILDSEHFVCSDQKFELMKEFHFRFIPKPEAETSDDNENGKSGALVSEQPSPSPIALQQLFKAYALQASGVCQQFLAENVDWAMRSMSDDDEELFKLVKFMPSEPDRRREADADEDKLTSHVTIPEPLPGGGGLPFGELVYMPELEGELEPGDLERQREVARVDLRDKPKINRFMWACERRFRPVYSKLVVPIVRLAKLGYTYAGRELDKLRAKLASDEVNTWKMITLICESRGRVQLVGDDGDNLRPLQFVPPVSRSIGAHLWISGAEQLAFELKNSDAMHLRGFQKFLHDSHLAGRNFAAAIDPMRFAWYRENKVGISVMLNTIRIMTQFIGKSMKVARG